jgi:uncharacterized protein YciI
VPLWVRTLIATAAPDEIGAARAGHLAHLAELRSQGRLRAAGAFTREDGFLEIFEARDLVEAERIARQSPLVERGLCSWTLREWIELDPAAR